MWFMSKKDNSTHFICAFFNTYKSFCGDWNIWNSFEKQLLSVNIMNLPILPHERNNPKYYTVQWWSSKTWS